MSTIITTENIPRKQIFHSNIVTPKNLDTENIVTDKYQHFGSLFDSS